MKKTLVLVLFIVLCLALCGCATVRYSVVITDGGARTYEFVVTYDDSVDLNSSEVLSLQTFFTYYANQNPRGEFVYDQNEPRKFTLRISYESVEDYYTAIGVTGDEVGEPIEGENQGLFKVYTQTLFTNADFASYALTYLSACDSAFVSDLSYYLTIRADQAAPTIRDTVRNIGLSKDVLGELQTQLAEYEEADKLADYVIVVLKDCGYDFAQVAFYLDYSHCYKSVQGVEPDEISVITTDMGSQTVYTWKFDPLNAKKIEITQTSPNVWIWEVIAIVFGVLVGAVCITMFFVGQKNGGNKMNKPVVESDNVNAKPTLDSTDDSDDIFAEDDSSDDDSFGEIE